MGCGESKEIIQSIKNLETQMAEKVSIFLTFSYLSVLA
jgi:hypothetical protein